MDTRLRVSIQSAKSENLSKRQQYFLAGLKDRLERVNLQVMPDSRTNATIAERLEKIRDGPRPKARCAPIKPQLYCGKESSNYYKRLLLAGR